MSKTLAAVFLGLVLLAMIVVGTPWGRQFVDRPVWCGRSCTAFYNQAPLPTVPGK